MCTNTIICLSCFEQVAEAVGEDEVEGEEAVSVVSDQNLEDTNTFIVTFFFILIHFICCTFN